MVRHSEYLHVGVECEIAVFMGAPLPPRRGGHSLGSVAGAVQAVFAGIEIVDDRWEDYKSVDTPSLIADDFFGAGCVLGQPVTDWKKLDLPALRGEMRVNDEKVGEGRGADILGHPFEALAWLANSLNDRGEGLKQGEIVMLGSLVQTQWVNLMDRVEVEIEGLGGAAVWFG
jgi:2-oxo-3-hexenedioate decarboxylase/2-keto-4-pentenoate hydratase